MNVLLALSIPCWLIPLLVGVICAILGYLLGRLLGGGSQQNNTDLNVYKNRISKLETDLAACKASKDSVSRSSGAGNTATSFTSNPPASTTAIKKEATASVTPVVTNLTNTSKASAITFDAAAAKLALGKKIKEDDLTVVEGIGPKIKELFHSHNITTWTALAGCTVEKCQEVLKSGGKRFEIHKPGTWPKQADLAAKGLWQELKDWQDQLDGGK